MPFLAFVLVGLVDRDGRRIRMAMAEVAARQRERWRTGTIPLDPLSAEAWLAANPEAKAADRASVLVTAGRIPEALTLLDEAVGETPSETVGIARLRLTLDPGLTDDASGRTALERFERLPELAALPEDERRYHRVAAAWSIAWLAIRDGRPWRSAFADAIRHLGPGRVPLRYRVFHAIQQFAMAIAYVLALLIVTLIGLTDLLL
jgi:hypothetical protein